MFKRYTFLLAACLALPAQAGWYLDNESSRLSFISTKAGNFSEVHRFLTLHGKVDDQGAARLRIEMESVSTGIPVRDERLRSLLFEVSQFADAHVMAQLNLGLITDLAPGAQLELSLPIQVEIRGRKHGYMAELLATRLDDQRFQVVTLAPLVIDAGDFGLEAGVEALRKAARLSSISLSVPVGAVLIFTVR
ncbi:YceI family protein [Aquipseudomonas ullengensis]|uniref:YceI family protein n=1 Tax=Aquipseudomonas ullengensis TaxID=2759166 RepID=A0A7W4QE05_9GAMM|nr:YceI family protein [Pseudomonas ullengensis]MBB2496621.1 YceI family protein [Pseudomonas ullengensis]